MMALYVGLMSGTSMDGIDAALVDVSSNRLIHGITKQYSDQVRLSLSALMNQQELTLPALCQLNTLIGREFAAATLQLLTEAQVSAQAVVAIGSHGQTVCHDAEATVPYTLQLGCAHTISSYTGIQVVADFRTRDLVHGGQGAPFAPLYHQELLAQQKKNSAVVNVGGISNVTFIGPERATCGWDVGPGNCLLDAWILRHHRQSFDAHGAWSRQGRVIAPLLQQLLADSFFQKKAPKSIGKEYFSLQWLEQYILDSYQAVDVQATLLRLTATPIIEAISAEPPVEQLYLCGGGVHNEHLLQTLSSLLPHIKVSSIQDIGVNPDYLEAMMFAWLAAQTVHSKSVDLRAITGTREPIILGALYPLNQMPST